MLDMVRPEENDKISLRDLKKCRMTPIFFDTFFNLEKYLDHEQRDPFASHRAEDDGPEVSARTGPSQQVWARSSRLPKASKHIHLGIKLLLFINPIYMTFHNKFRIHLVLIYLT